MTEQQKETMRRNREARAATKAEREEQEKMDRAATVETMRAIRDNPEATVEQKIFAVLTLDALLYRHLVPYELGKNHAGAVDFSEFKKEVDELTARFEAANNGKGKD